MTVEEHLDSDALPVDPGMFSDPGPRGPLKDVWKKDKARVAEFWDKHGTGIIRGVHQGVSYEILECGKGSRAQDIHAGVTDFLDIASPAIRDLMQSAGGIRIVGVENVDDWGELEGDVQGKFCGFFHHSGFWMSTRPSDSSNPDVKGTTVHEIAHYADRLVMFGTDLTFASDLDSFKTMYADAERFDFIRSYSTTDQHEGWATLIEMDYSGGRDLNEKRAFHAERAEKVLSKMPRAKSDDPRVRRDTYRMNFASAFHDWQQAWSKTKEKIELAETKRQARLEQAYSTDMLVGIKAQQSTVGDAENYLADVEAGFQAAKAEGQPTERYPERIDIARGIVESEQKLLTDMRKYRAQHMEKARELRARVDDMERRGYGTGRRQEAEDLWKRIDIRVMNTASKKSENMWLKERIRSVKARPGDYPGQVDTATGLHINDYDVKIAANESLITQYEEQERDLRRALADVVGKRIASRKAKIG